MNVWPPELGPPFHLSPPARQSVPVVVNSPHSGSLYPASFLAASRLDPLSLRRSEDAHVGALFACAPELGAPLLEARFPRAFLDVNREPWELDPAMFSGPLPAHANISSIRVAAGLGTIARIVSEHDDIYSHKLAPAEATARVETLYFPYHAALDALCARTLDTHGAVLLLDVHSMPASAAATGMQEAGTRPDVVLGDRHGTACAGEIAELLENLMAAEGLKIARNRPYAGGFITQSHGKPRQNRHAIQIEICRALYMNEATLEPGPGFAALQASLSRVLDGLFAAIPQIILPWAEAAE
jgi:N-formylglutamate amidohydrolase